MGDRFSILKNLKAVLRNHVTCMQLQEDCVCEWFSCMYFMTRPFTYCQMQRVIYLSTYMASFYGLIMLNVFLTRPVLQLLDAAQVAKSSFRRSLHMCSCSEICLY